MKWYENENSELTLQLCDLRILGKKVHFRQSGTWEKPKRKMACYTRSRKRKSMTKHFQLFNCDRTCSLTPISSLLHLVEKKSDFKIVVEERAFSQSDVDTLIEQVIPNLRMDYGVLTVHARDSIPFIEDGYGKICKAILQRMKVLGSGRLCFVFDSCTHKFSHWLLNVEIQLKQTGIWVGEMLAKKWFLRWGGGGVAPENQKEKRGDRAKFLYEI